ncbi:uroporphyrinogen-III C-methyltransferase [Shewanella cyperi]|uniref:uroporphyrinogen-III C-methyltransferase n=1 Tax=Shewanella cyperi TaxID=2814292 RepID=UPI001A9426DA|nr:uroporphyrinogen-III C-methyltransferase [Shewanella cyperi]QSX42156.1 uroporphyrinogen-III C-methyltransferase [Shewanella cyperi]
MADLTSLISALGGEFLPGTVVLAGAGCGDVGSLTLDVLALLRRCDALVYDALVDESVLALANPGARRIAMGKRAGGQSAHQDEINLCLATLAGEGLRVLRLKGGDPGVFGRGGEEAAFLLTRGIDCRWLPGVSAALGCGAAAMIPLTHRGQSRSVTLITGRQIGGNASRHWQQSLALGSTLVFYMGAAQAAAIAASLKLAGADGALSCALVRDGGRPGQRLEFCCLDELATAARNLGGDGPCLIMVGEVCAIGEELTALRAGLGRLSATEVAHG